ncbi:MAG: YIP1 family protein [Planctomycetota bacterium]
MLCPKCNRAISLDYGQDKCPRCGETIGMADSTIKKPPEGLQPPPQQPPQPPNPQVTINEYDDMPPTWDDEGPFFSRLWNTFVSVMFHPKTFFSQTPTEDGIGKPLLYAIIVGSIGTIAVNFWMLMLISMYMPQMVPGQSVMMASSLSMNMIFQIFMAPIQVIIYTFIQAGILHLSLMVIKGNEQGFEATYRAVVYSMSTYWLNLIPFCLGAPVGAIWQIVLIIIGLREVHGISTGKAVVAWFLPILFCCGCGGGLFAFGMLGALGNALSGGPPSYGY